MNGDESKKLPRGRQTIRKSGSLLGFHGPVSRRIKLWTADANHNTTIAQLERAYFAALESVDRFDERSSAKRRKRQVHVRGHEGGCVAIRTA